MNNNPDNIKLGDQVLLLKDDDQHIPVYVVHIGHILAMVSKEGKTDNKNLSLVKINQLSKPGI